MKFVKVDKSEFRVHRMTFLEKLVYEFLESGYEVAAVKYEKHEYSTDYAVAAALNRTIARCKLSGVRCIVRSKQAYLMRTDIDDCE